MIKTYDVFRAIYSKLKTLPYEVYDEVPKTAKNPHIRIDASYNIDKSGKNYDGIVYYQYIHVFSTYNGRKEILEMVDSIIELLSEDIETDEFVAYSALERNDITTKAATVGGDVTGYYINEQYRHALLEYRFVIYKK
jgi:BRCT domain type II-containing protein